MKLHKSILLLSVLGAFGIFGFGGSTPGFVTITPQEAKNIMDTEQGYAIVDVRESFEYKEGHIPNAILLPLSTIEKNAEKVLTNKNQQLLVYCRSGRRSKQAASILVSKGYTNVKDFGGIIDWPYEVVK